MALNRPTVKSNLSKSKPAPAAVQEEAAEEELRDTSVPYAEPASQPDVPNAAGSLPVQRQSTVPSVSRPPSTAMTTHTNDADFDDLDSEIGFGSFDILKLDKTEFVCGNHTFDEFQCVLHQGRKKFLFKADDDHLVYSYDGILATDGRALEDHFSEWRAEGYLAGDESPSRSRYYEVAAEIVGTDTELDGDMVLLSIPPASVSRLSGYKAKLKLRGMRLNEAVTLCKKGPKVSLQNGKITFYPWDFQLAGKVGSE